MAEGVGGGGGTGAGGSCGWGGGGGGYGACVGVDGDRVVGGDGVGWLC